MLMDKAVLNWLPLSTVAIYGVGFLLHRDWGEGEGPQCTV